MIISLILFFSIYGRDLQYWLSHQFTRQELVILFSVVLVSMSVGAAVFLIRHRGWRYGWHMIWFVFLFVVLPFYVSFVEERIHFILFGAFGFLTLLIYPWLLGFVICMMVSGLDEVLQHVLPDRVGDWRDVMFNFLAASGGGMFALVLKE